MIMDSMKMGVAENPTCADTAILLFRNDLRTRDNETLFRAIDSGSKIIPVFVFDDRHFGTDRWGFRKTGPYRTKFLLETVEDLRKQLRLLGGDLIIRKGITEEVIREIADQTGAHKIYIQKEVTDEEISVERAISEFMQVEFVWGHTLYHIKDIPFKIRDFPDVFTSFRKKTENVALVRELIDTPEHIPFPKEISIGNLPTINELGFESTAFDQRGVLEFKGGSGSAKDRIQHYFWDSQKLRNYKQTRNGLLGADYSAKLSPWLANGSLSPREVYFEVQKFETQIKSNESTYWLVFELIWRDFFRFHAAKAGNRMFKLRGLKENVPSLRADLESFEVWQKGRTTNDFINANMKELLHTGWMSNRGRQVVASNLVHDLGVDWRLGAAWFESMLIDYDPCSNYGNWQYVAGVGTDPRKDRYFNIDNQVARYDPEKKFIRHWLS